MRRKDREISSRDDILKILKEEKICRLALKDEPYPYIVPMNYGLESTGDQTVLYFHCAGEGRKLELLKKDCHVAFEIDRMEGLTVDDEKGSCSTLYESVMGFGDVSFTDGEEKMKALRLILAQCGRGEEFKINEELAARTICFKLEVKEITGKKH